MKIVRYGENRKEGRANALLEGNVPVCFFLPFVFCLLEGSGLVSSLLEGSGLVVFLFCFPRGNVSAFFVVRLGSGNVGEVKRLCERLRYSVLFHNPLARPLRLLCVQNDDLAGLELYLQERLLAVVHPLPQVFEVQNIRAVELLDGMLHRPLVAGVDLVGQHLTNDDNLKRRRK